jgi:hypothetical protein
MINDIFFWGFYALVFGWVVGIPLLTLWIAVHVLTEDKDNG